LQGVAIRMGKTHLFDKPVQNKAFFSKPIESISLLVKVRLNKNRSQGARIESVPLKRLIELSKLSFHSWRLEKVGESWWLIIIGA
jgi:hypothetical protein